MNRRQPRTATSARAESAPAAQARPPVAQVSRADHDPRPSRGARAGDTLLQLQQQYGNRYVQQVIQHAARSSAAAPVVQAKMVLGPAGDRFEREADQVARNIARSGMTRAARFSSSASRTGTGRPAGAQAGAMAPELQRAIQRARAGGQAVPPHVRAPMERALGADLRGVRLHTSDTADRLNRVLRARAFTTGQDIFFRRDEYTAGSSSSRALLAHELTHVVQQNPLLAGQADPSGDGPPVSQAASGSVVQRMFPAAPHAGDLGEINRIDNKPALTAIKHQGVTSQPVNYIAPVYSVDVEKRRQNDFVAKVRLVGSGDIGDCEATYLAKGSYDSRFLWALDPAYAAGSASTRMLDPHGYLGHPPPVAHVIERVTANIARGSKAAEQEHLNDYRCAYDLTLGAAEGAIGAVAGAPFAGTTGKKAKSAAETELRQRLRMRSNGNLDSLDPAVWRTRYAELFRRSGTNRDAPGYHNQDYVEDGYWNTGIANQLSSVKWGFPVHHVKVVPGPLRLGIPSRDVIDPNPH